MNCAQFVLFLFWVHDGFNALFFICAELYCILFKSLASHLPRVLLLWSLKPFHQLKGAEMLPSASLTDFRQITASTSVLIQVTISHVLHDGNFFHKYRKSFRLPPNYSLNIRDPRWWPFGRKILFLLCISNRFKVLLRNVIWFPAVHMQFSFNRIF